MEKRPNRTGNAWTPAAVLIILEIAAIVLVKRFLEGAMPDMPFMGILTEIAVNALVPLSVVTAVAVALAILVTLANNRRY